MLLPFPDEWDDTAETSRDALAGAAAASAGAVEVLGAGGRGGLPSGERMEVSATGCKAAAAGTDGAGFATETWLRTAALFVEGPRLGERGDAAERTNVSADW